MKKYDISSLGEILIDFTYLGDSKNKQKLFEQNPGGAPANVLAAASRLGSNTAFLGKAGLDMHGEFLKNVLNKENINTDGFILDKNFFTTLAFVDLNEFKERSFSFARKPGADTNIEIDELNYDALSSTKIFHVGSLSLTHEPARSTTHHAIKYAKDSGALISYDPNYRASLWDSEIEAKKHMSTIIPDIMKVSDEETVLLTSFKEYDKAAKFLLDKGIKIVVVTLGPEGCYVLNKDGGVLVPGFKSVVEDTTGAGDGFWGAFLHKVTTSNKSIEELSIDDLKEFARFANCVASICVEKTGAILSMPTLSEVNNKLMK